MELSIEITVKTGNGNIHIVQKRTSKLPIGASRFRKWKKDHFVQLGVEHPNPLPSLIYKPLTKEAFIQIRSSVNYQKNTR